jgi:branched-chain amino acid transport system substrate-binding protein
MQAAISKGAKQFAIIGSTAFMVSAVKSLKQLGFKGRVIISLTSVVPADIASLPNGLDGITNITNQTNDPDDPDVKLYKAILAKYAPDGTGVGGDRAFITTTALIRALAQVHGVDAKSVSTVLGAMPNPIKVPYGSGETFRCGAKVVPLIPNACSADALTATLDKDGAGHGYQPI